PLSTDPGDEVHPALDVRHAGRGVAPQGGRGLGGPALAGLGLAGWVLGLAGRPERAGVPGGVETAGWTRPGTRPRGRRGPRRPEGWAAGRRLGCRSGLSPRRSGRRQPPPARDAPGPRHTCGPPPAPARGTPPNLGAAPPPRP